MDRVSQAAAPDATRTVVDKVYVEAQPEPAVVHVNKPPRDKGSVATTNEPRDDERELDERGDHDEHDGQGERGDE